MVSILSFKMYVSKVASTSNVFYIAIKVEAQSMLWNGVDIASTFADNPFNPGCPTFLSED